MQAGNVWLPRAQYAPWLCAWVEEHATFPNAATDDQVDATSQALILLNDGKFIDPLARLKQQFGGIL